MNSHLALLAHGKPLTLPDDASMDIEMRNPLFNDDEMFSLPMTLPLDGNREFLKNMEDINSNLRPVDVEHTPIQILADGLPMGSGMLVTQEDERLEDSISVSVDAAEQSFRDLISDLECQDVPLKDQILIGEKIGDVTAYINFWYHAKVNVGGKKGVYEYSSLPSHMTGTMNPQALGFSYPGICETIPDTPQWAKSGGNSITYPNKHTVRIPQVETSFINVTDAYPEKPYCNARVAYKHYDVEISETSETTSDSIVLPKDSTGLPYDKSPYWVLEADRPQSGLCFYVLYFLDCLFKHLGVTFDNSEILAVEDMKHLCFFTTKCGYDEGTEPLYGGTKENPLLKNTDQVNEWLNSRGCGGQLIVGEPETKTVEEADVYRENPMTGELEFFKNFKVGDNAESIELISEVSGYNITANVYAMYANSENFPDESVSTVLDSLENAFGIKFSYDYEKKHVKAYFIRDVFRKQSKTTVPFNANFISMNKVAEKITGVRMRYSAEDDKKDQQKYLRDSYRNKNMDYDTDYNYIDYPQDRTVYRQNIYKDIFREVSNNDKNVYIDLTTGNAYRVKVDKDASTIKDLRPVLFEVGTWKGVEFGDCSSINEDFVQEFAIDFSPVSFNDVNYHLERQMAYGELTGTTPDGYDFRIKNFNETSNQPILAAFVDEDMEHEFVLQEIHSPVSNAVADIPIVQQLRLRESYDPSKTEDGNSPLQSYNWGFSLALMRGGGTNMTFQSYAGNYDGFGNSKWRTVAGEYALTSDSMDQFGNDFDYNGIFEGIGPGERFSLKIRAYKQPEWANQPLCNSDVMDEQGNITRKIRSRGLFDTFLIDYAYFLVNRKKYIVRCNTTVAQVADIPNHWKEWWLINGKKCLINKVNTTIDIQTGMGEVELEVYSL